MNKLSMDLIGIILQDHPQPWNISVDWGYEVIDLNGKRVGLFQNKQDAALVVEMAERYEAGLLESLMECIAEPEREV